MVETKQKKSFLPGRMKNKPKRKIALIVFVISVLALASVAYFRWEAVLELLPADTAVHKYMISSSDIRKCVPYKDAVILCGKSGIAAVTARGGEKWRIHENIDYPLVAVAGDHIAVSSKSGKAIYSISGDGKFKEFDSEMPVENIKAGENGSILTIVNEKNYNGSVIVYTNAGKPLFRWAAGTYHLIDAALSPDGKRLAASVIDTNDAKVNGSILLFDITKSEKQYAQKTDEGNMVSAVKWADNKTIIAVGDKKLSVLTDKATEKWAYSLQDQVLNFFDISENNNLVMVTGGSSMDRQMSVKSFTLAGKMTGEYRYEGHIGNISTSTGRILISSMYEVVMIDRYGHLKAQKNSEKEIFGSYMYKSGGSVFLDEGGFAEIFRMK